MIMIMIIIIIIIITISITVIIIIIMDGVTEGSIVAKRAPAVVQKAFMSPSVPFMPVAIIVCC